MGSTSSAAIPNHTPIGRKCNCQRSTYKYHSKAKARPVINKPKSSNGFIIDKGFKKPKPKKEKKKKNLKLHDYCCSIEGCISSMGSLIKFKPELNGHQYFSNIHRQALNQTLISTVDSNVNWKYFVDIIASHLLVGSTEYDQYMVLSHGNPNKEPMNK